MAGFVVYLITYDDLDLLKGAVASIPDGVTTYVLDGRYADFPGETINTPGCREWCESQPDVIYDSPESLLPWGHEGWEDEPQLRHPIHAQATYANYELLPQDEWVLHLDADERLDKFDVDLESLPRDHKFMPYINSLAPRGISVPRLYVPKHWTFWIAGVMYPRDVVPRTASLPDLLKLHIETSYQDANRGWLTKQIRVNNYGNERPPDYHLRRAKQLETMGRSDRAQDYLEKVEERGEDDV